MSKGINNFINSTTSPIVFLVIEIIDPKLSNIIEAIITYCKKYTIFDVESFPKFSAILFTIV